MLNGFGKLSRTDWYKRFSPVVLVDSGRRRAGYDYRLDMLVAGGVFRVVSMVRNTLEWKIKYGGSL